MKFIVVSDLHIDDYSRFAKPRPDGMNSRLYWSLHILRQIKDYAKHNNISTVLLGGDIFDKRGQISVLAYDACYALLREMVDEGITILGIVGNHDQATKRGLIHSLNPLPIRLIKDEIVILDTNLSIAGIGFKETPHDFLESVSRLAIKKPNIWLIHQGINGAKIAGDEILSRDETDLKDLRELTGDSSLILSGHYHIHQRLDSSFYYIGSATPKDFSDTTPKGFLVLDYATQGLQSLEFFESEAPRFKTLSLDIGSERLIQEATGNYVRIEYSKPAAVLEKLPAIAEGLLLLERNEEDQAVKRSEIDIESGPKKAIFDYLTEAISKGILKADQEKEAKEQLEHILSSINLNDGFGGHQVKVQKIHIRNFLSYKDTQFDFNSCGTLIQIEGENTDDPCASSNGAGKSGFPESIRWCLYGETARGLQGDEVIADFSSGDCSVEVFLEIDSRNFRVFRTRKHKEFKNQLFFEELKEGTIVDLRSKNDSETQNLIIKYTGFDSENFDNTVFFGHSFRASFAGLTDSNQKQILEDILGFNYFREIYIEIKEQANLIKKVLLEEETKASYLRRSLEEKKNNKDNLNKKSIDYLENKEVRILNLKKQMSDLPVPRTYRDFEVLEKNIESKLSELSSFEEDLNVMADVEKLLREAQTQVSKLTQDKIKKESQVSLLSNNIENNLEKLIRLTSSEDLDSVCASCGQKYDLNSEFVKAEVEKKIKEEKQIQDLITAQESDLSIISEEILKIEYNIKIKESEVNELEKLAEKNGRALQNINILNREISKLKQEFSLAETECLNYTNSLKRLEAEIYNVNAEVNPYVSLYDIALQEYTATLQELALLNQTLDLLKLKADIFNFWELAFSDKGSPAQIPLKSYIFDTLLPVLNNYLSFYSEEITEGSIEVKFNTVSKLKSGLQREKFNIEVKNKYGANSYLGDSSGERRRVDLVIMFALHALIRSRSGSNINILFLDEILDALDLEGATRVLRVLKELGSKIGHVFVITHNESLKQFLPETLTVRKSNRISVLL